MFKLLLVIAVFAAAAVVADLQMYHPQACSSPYYHRRGKCGLSERSYLRCAQGEWCSQHGYCGSDESYKVNAICGPEKRPTGDIEYESAKDDPFLEKLKDCCPWARKKSDKQCKANPSSYESLPYEPESYEPAPYEAGPSSYKPSEDESYKKSN